MRLARLGYLTAIALWPGATIPGWASGLLNLDLEKCVVALSVTSSRDGLPCAKP